MQHAINTDRIMDGFPETYVTIFAAVMSWSSGADILTVFVMSIAGFFWLITIRRTIEEKYKNSIWNAIKSLFRKRNKYGK